MTDVRHPGLAAGRWREFSLAVQLGNVGSEVSRTRTWRDRNPRIARAAFERALELMDLTLADPKHRGARRRIRELARVREVMVDFFAGSNEYRSTGESMQRYFDAYAVAARRGPRIDRATP